MSKKLLVAGVVLSLVAVMLVGGGVQTASAQTMTLCQTVDALIAAGVIAPDKVAAAKAAAGCTAAPAGAYTFTRSLTLGSTSADVTALQNFLISSGYQIPAGATGYFGAQTQAALVAYQAAKNILPSVGYFGPLTMASVNAPTVIVVPASTVPGCAAGAAFSATTGAPCSSVSTVPGCAAGTAFSATTGAPCTGGSAPVAGLSGSFGTISSISKLSTYNDEEVGEGENNVKVLGAEIEASNDGDIALKSVRVKFTSTGSSQSTRISDYVDTVTIWMGSTKIGTADASDFNKDRTGIYTKTISLSDAVIRADKKEKIYISIDAVNRFDSGDIVGTDWDLSLESVRFIDGSGVTTTEDTLGDLVITVPVDFVSFSTSANTEMKISTDNTPDASVVFIDDVKNTDNILLLKGKIKVDGSSDILLDELPITLTSSSSTGSLSAITGNLVLVIDNEKYSKSVTATSSTATTTFDNLNITLKAGRTYSFTISADINDTDPTFEEGTSLTASLTATNRAFIVVENEQGDQLSASEKSGTALGEAQTFYVSGIVVTVIGTPTGTVTTNDGLANDSVTYTVALSIKAEGDALYVSHATTTESTYLDSATSTVSEARLSANTIKTGDDGSKNYFYLNEGESRNFTYTLILTATSTASTISNFSMIDIGWGLTPTAISSYGGNLDGTAVIGSKLLN